MARLGGRLYVPSVHLADGIVTSPGWLLGVNAAGGAAAVLVGRHLRDGGERGLAFTGTLAAFVLAAQALNVPLVPGASAHVIGAGLLTLAIGPARAVLALVAVLVVQALLLADGGITALGINVLNIAVLPVLAVHGVHRLLGPGRLGLSAVLGTLLGNVLSALSLAFTLVAAAGVPAGLAFGWLVGIQALAGCVEGVLTALALGHLVKLAPGLLAATRTNTSALPPLLEGPSVPVRSRRMGFVWAALAVGIACALLPLATETPDALGRVVEHARPSP
ncbi:MAG: energy-coupling factor ABC transporter permease [Myxococcales bacterium]|nr:energy-coupling factor ABC transporter permease [Myxococcales bacterium]